MTGTVPAKKAASETAEKNTSPQHVQQCPSNDLHATTDDLHRQLSIMDDDGGWSWSIR